ncbi:MAG: DcrB-related protein [bacterium]
MFSSPTTETDKIRENVGITKKPLTKEYTLDEYFTLTNDELKKQPNYAEVENTTIKINDIDAKKTIYKFSSNDTKIQSEQILLIKDKMLYTITYTATEATFNEYAQNFDEMVATLEIK